MPIELRSRYTKGRANVLPKTRRLFISLCVFIMRCFASMYWFLLYGDFEVGVLPTGRLSTALGQGFACQFQDSFANHKRRKEQKGKDLCILSGAICQLLDRGLESREWHLNNILGFRYGKMTSGQLATLTGGT